MYHSLSNNATKDTLISPTLPIEAWALLHKQILFHLYQQQQQQQQEREGGGGGDEEQPPAISCDIPL